MTEKLPKFLNVKQVAEVTGMHTGSVRRLLGQGKIKGATKIGRNWMVPKESIIDASIDDLYELLDEAEEEDDYDSKLEADIHAHVVGANMKLLRFRAGYRKADDLAHLIQVPVETYLRWERAVTPIPLFHAVRLADFYGIPLEIGRAHV